MLKLAVRNTLTQWIGTDTRFRLDLVFMKDPKSIESITCNCPQEKSDHVMIEVLMTENLGCIREEDHKIRRKNYKRWIILP